MNTEYLTLSRKDSQFNDYLLGTFSVSERALPVPPLGEMALGDQITFQIMSVSKIEKPGFLGVLWRLWRPQLATLTLGPLLVTLAYLWTTGVQIAWAQSALAILAVWLFHGAVFMFNDYSDHVRGVDRAGQGSGSQVIQLGWATASQLRKWATVIAAMGAAVGLPLVLAQPASLLSVALWAGLGVLGYSYKGRGLKYSGLGELITFLCLGILLTFGISRVATQSNPQEIFYLGSFFGLLANLVLFTRQFERLMSDGQLKVKTLLVRLGFDRARWLLVGTLAFTCLAFAGCFWLRDIYMRHFILTIPVWWLALSMAKTVAEVKSPVSSKIGVLKSQGAWLHLAMSGSLISLFLIP